MDFKNEKMTKARKYEEKVVDSLSKTSWALIVKFLATLAASTIAFYSWGWAWAIGVAILGTALNYILVDLMFLPFLGNLGATIVDGGLSMLTADILGAMFRAFNPSFSSILLYGVLVAVVEYFFHIFLSRSNKVAP